MTNKEFFKTLNKEQQLEIVSTLSCYDKVHVEFYNGEYHITTSWSLLAKYPKDFKVLNEFKNSEFNYDGHDYNNEWYEFWNAKERKGLKNTEGKWQDEFEELWQPIYNKAREEYLK